MNDIDLLGSAIYSQWRYFNHWAYSGEEILELRNRSWFILELDRLAMLAGENLFALLFKDCFCRCLSLIVVLLNMGSSIFFHLNIIIFGNKSK